MIRVFLFTKLVRNFISERPFFAVLIDSKMCLRKFSFSSSRRPICLVESLRATGIPLKESEGWLPLLYLLEKITSIACFEMSGLNFIFHWLAQIVIVFRSLIRVCWATSISGTLKRDASSAKSLILAEIFWVRSFI